MDNMKKDFQKVVKMFRYDHSCGDYPKAMMTGQQMRKNTATVNCDFGDVGKSLAETFVKYGPFVDWCESYGIKSVKIESVSIWSHHIQWQVRVLY